MHGVNAAWQTKRASNVSSPAKRQHRKACPSEIARGSFIRIAAPRTAKHQDTGSSRSADPGIEMPDQPALMHVQALDFLCLCWVASASEN